MMIPSYKPIISVITVVRNSEHFLEKTIQNITSQQNIDLEYIIIDGKSTDQTVFIIKKYENKINYWSSELDNGIYDAMNKGIAKANGEWVIFMNSGDLFASKNVLSQIFKNPISPNIQVIIGQTWMKTNEKLLLQTNNYFSDTYKNKGILIVNHQSTIIRKEAFNIIGNYNTSLKFASDNLWLNRTIKYFGIESLSYINIPITIFDTSGISSDTKNHLKVVNEFLKISREIDGSLIRAFIIMTKGYLKSLYYFIKQN